MPKRLFSASLLPVLLVSLAGCSAYDSVYNPAAKPVSAVSPLPPGSAATVYTLSNSLVYNQSGCPTTFAYSVLGYPANAVGSASPTLTLASPNPADNYFGLATDSAGNIYVLANNISPDCQEVAGSQRILVFPPSTNGTMTATPVRTITGPATQIADAARIAVDHAGNIYLWEAGSGAPSYTPATIVEFAAGANGNVAPIRTLNVPAYPDATGSGGGFPAGLAVDAAGNIVFAVSNSPVLHGTVSTESDTIEVFTPSQSGSATPARTISGPQSQLTQIAGLALDATGNIYVDMAEFATGANPAILEFAGGASPTAATAPINTIAGSYTMLDRFFLNSLSVDPAGNIYVLTYTFPGIQTNYLLRFAPGATGNATPSAAALSQEGVLLATH